MKFIYGKQDWKTLERGEENCYLLTNGLGGFSSMTMTGAAARNDHAVLMACIKAPNHRYNLVHRLKEQLKLEGKEKSYVLSTQEFADRKQEEGFQYLSSFSYEDTPVCRFLAEGVEIVKEIGMEQNANTVALRYEIVNRGKESCKLQVTPFFQFVAKGKDMDPDQELELRRNTVESNGIKLHFRTNGIIETIPTEEETYYYRYDQCDGRRGTGLAKANHIISATVNAGETEYLDIIYELESSTENAAQIIEDMKTERRKLEQQAGFTSVIARILSKSASQFVSARESTGGKTILAGYPFFEDWGRDTMIALPGICISTGQYETAKEILRTFAVNEKDGLMPNLFPEGQNAPMYNTVDAALLFINCVYLYYQAAKDQDFLREVYPVMERIVTAYKRGTHFGIRMDIDGLIQAGEGLAQLTWMDVRVGDFLPTPRHGKPVEINAYWYNALKVMEYASSLCGKEGSFYGKLARKVKESFTENFWMEDKKCLRDLVSGTKADRQIRCNQIWAVSMPFTMLDEDKERQVVETVFQNLYTPYGLRTLEKNDREFHPYYEGPMEQRDMAYHQGTVWTFPMGAYYLAYLKVNKYSEEAKETVKKQLEVLESAMREGCIGQLPEIYDGENPVSSKGCYAQAWSVGEILRVFEILEKG